MRKIELMAALCLMSAYVLPHAQAAPQPSPTPTPGPGPITIASLPFNILAAGNYILAQDFFFPAISDAAITVGLAGPIPGPITIDFKGHTITGTYPVHGPNIYGIFIQTSNPGPVYPLIIQNGTLASFPNGIANSGVGTQAPQVTIRNMSFNQNYIGVLLGNTYGATVKNCQFNGLFPLPDNNANYGIYDGQDYGNNTFNSNTFTHIYVPLFVTITPPANTPWLPPRSPKYIVTNAQLFPSGAK